MYIINVAISEYFKYRQDISFEKAVKAMIAGVKEQNQVDIKAKSIV